LRREVNYLGHVITEDGVKLDRAKVECIAKYPVPRHSGEQLDKEYTEHICSQHSGQVIGFLNEIYTNKDYILSIVERPKTQHFRTKRGLINIIGRVANVLFGVCDDVDTDYFHKKVKKLEHSKARLSQIAATQTQITKSIVINVNSFLIELESKEKTLSIKRV